MHTIHILALWDNYSIVEADAARQRFSVIFIIDTDGYEHVLVQIETLLTDLCGDDPFSVTTPEEVIAIRRDTNAGFATTMVKIAGRRGGGEFMYGGMIQL